ncbi:cytochrome P450 [Hansschlegelia zhihuaiae]|uniref:Cytochrome P450 n=1 Tax=Hansschlegelia zhihuaiae TaxID=405005 RepID=A0A4Q0MNP4_9HYPH|nr:cytochrome P450 [Hansschlegelia zhihuaiae]RXF75175.1 cytochrome P450 [Hansschlegelia zhihuaiae]
MGAYLDRIDAAPASERWRLVRGLMYGEPQPFFAELRAERPVLELPDLTIVTRFADCALTLRRHQDFGVDLYRPKQGDYFMAQDDTADHWRDKSIMRAILDFEQVPRMRAHVGDTARDILREAGGAIDAPKRLTRAVPISLVKTFFGFDDADDEQLFDWSYWNQQDAFHNQFFDAIVTPDPQKIVRERERANTELALFTARVMAKRSVAVKLGFGGDDSISRLIHLSFSGGVNFPLKKVLFNAGGLLIGAVETTSHAVNNALAELLKRPDVLDRARAAAASPDAQAFDGFVFEALRFNPAFPYFFRTCHRRTVMSAGTPEARAVEPNATVLAVTHSAMFDEAAFEEPDRFDEARSQADAFTFGQGLHECLGRVIAQAMIPEVVRQCLLLPNLRAEGPVRFEGGVPESFPLRWG